MSNFLTSILLFTARRTEATAQAHAAPSAAAIGTGPSTVSPDASLRPPTDESHGMDAARRPQAIGGPGAGEVVEQARDGEASGPSDGLLPMVAYPIRRQEQAASKARGSRALKLPRASTSVALTSSAAPLAMTTVSRPRDAQRSGPFLTGAERVRLQVMQVQIRLAGLSLYEGPIDGILSPETVTGVRHFQTLKAMRDTGTLTAGTLSALGVPAID
jgi:hypothetical protein